jgi:winged helix DNA-binding protein
MGSGARPAVAAVRSGRVPDALAPCHHGQTVLTRRALNRATLARQMLLERSAISVPEAIERLVGLQAQTPHTAYVGLWTRLVGFRPEHLADRIADRSVVRLALMRGTIHMVTARDAWLLRPLVQPVLDRVQASQFGRRIAGIDQAELIAHGRAFVEQEPRTFKQLGDHLLERWPGRDRMAMEQAIRAGVPLIQVPPRGLWGRSGPSAHTSIDAWLGQRVADTLSVDDMVLRYLGVFGPASVMDAQAWCGLTRLGDVFDRLRPQLQRFHDERGREVFDLADAPRPDPDTPAPPRFLYDYENLLLSYADRSRVIVPEEVARIEVRTNESISTFLVDGRVSGSWKIERERTRATLRIKPIRRLTKAELTSLADEGADLLEFAAADAQGHEVQLET